MAKISAVGDNVVCEQISKKEETICAKVVSIHSKKLKVGDIVFYGDRNYENLNVGNKIYHVIWLNFIRAVMIKEKEVKEILDDLPNMENK